MPTAREGKALEARGFQASMRGEGLEVAGPQHMRAVRRITTEDTTPRITEATTPVVTWALAAGTLSIPTDDVVE